MKMTDESAEAVIIWYVDELLKLGEKRSLAELVGESESANADAPYIVFLERHKVALDKILSNAKKGEYV